jgi:ribose transport system ATP-binding protein
MSDDAIEFEGISMSFGAVQALDDVNLRVGRGRIHALLGANGAGKSTLLKILSGVYPAGMYRGTISIGGAAFAPRGPSHALRLGIAYVPQEISVIEPLSVAENIFVGHTGRPGGWWVSRRELNQRARDFLREHAIDLDPSLPAALLNASQRHLVMIARALAVRPAVLILDEATASLTDHETGNLFVLLRRLRDKGQTCLFVTHRLQEVEDLADRVTVLRDGRLAGEFDRGGFTSDAVVTAMIGRSIDKTDRPERAFSPGDEVLRVEDLTIPHPRLAHRHVVDGVSFHLRRGEILGLAGLVGAGRSETLNALYGRLPHRGRVYIAGRAVRLESPQQAHRVGIGLLTEDRKRDGLLFNLDVRANVTVGALPALSRLGWLDRRRETQLAAEYFRLLSIKAPSLAAAVTALSGGNQQKVVLARLLLARPAILLLDEPTKGVDVAAKAEIHRLLLELARQGIAIVLVSCELDELLTLSDRIMVLSRGRVTDAMPREQASAARIMLAATGAAPQVRETPTARVP